MIPDGRQVLAVDPGKKTGLSLWVVNHSGAPPLVAELPWPEFPAYVDEVTTRYGGDLDVVCESFTITVQTAKNTQAPWSLEGIGVCRYLTARSGCGFTVQAPSSAKNFSSDERLRRLGWWSPGHGHGNDASRHLLLYVASRGWWDDRIAI